MRVDRRLRLVAIPVSFLAAIILVSAAADYGEAGGSRVGYVQRDGTVVVASPQPQPVLIGLLWALALVAALVFLVSFSWFRREVRRQKERLRRHQTQKDLLRTALEYQRKRRWATDVNT